MAHIFGSLPIQQLPSERHMILHGGRRDPTTVRLAVSVAVLNAVEPPFLEVLAKSPLVPLVWSQARKVMAVARVP